ncbi:MAG TPA: glycosyltransferase family 2 protein [Acidobacteriota bacterium]|nr:glycosyltransferase family 2 protein [Acidobacteriota bacterium]
MTKLIIQIPCHNEEQALPVTLSELPRELPGVDLVEWLVVDDGSNDRTVEVAKANGVDHIVELPSHQGLARAFVAGLEAAVQAGADIVVNTDADNQYPADEIGKLVAPILEGRAEVVIGARSMDQIEHFSPTKKVLQRLGSWVVRLVSRSDIPDAASGFRAMSRRAAMQTHVFSEYTYTLETIIQAGQKGMAITSVPVRVNKNLRPSRLVKSIPSYIRHQGLTIIRIFMTYRSFRFFFVPGLALFGVGFLIGLRFVYFYVIDAGAGHVQSLILASLLMGTGSFLCVVGLLADLISVNRRLLERVDWRLRELEEKIKNDKGAQ